MYALISNHYKPEGRFYCAHQGSIFALEIHAFEKILISFHTFLFALNNPYLSKVVIFCGQKQS